MEHIVNVKPFANLYFLIFFPEVKVIMYTIWNWVQCVVLGNVHISAPEGIGNSWGRGGLIGHKC